MRRFVFFVIGLAFIAAIVFYILTIPQTITAAELPQHTPDKKNGEYLFYAGGCASCHSAPPKGKGCEDLGSTEPTQLGGGRCLITPFGKFYVPNISSDKEKGIGGWSDAEFVTAMVRGVSPNGSHYYPAFPYTSYQKMRYEDLIDMKAYLDSLPAIQTDVPDHQLALPFQLRRGLGLWKMLYLDGKTFEPNDALSEKLNRGAYLTEGAGHCAECHTPRDLFGGMDMTKKFAGGPAPEGGGYIPNITPHETGIASWSVDELVNFFQTGFTPDFDSVGGTMAKVQENMSKLTNADLEAIAAYLKALKPIKSARSKSR